MMQKQHMRALKTARVSRQARQRHNTDDWEEVDGVGPDYDHMLLQEEEDLQRCKDAFMPKSGSLTVPFCCFIKVTQRHSQMTNTAKRQCTLDIYDNEKPDK
jgi:hypothetical protein